MEGSGLVRYDGEQVCDANVHSRLKEQSACLPAVMRLVIEEVLNQMAEVLGMDLACHVAVDEREC